MNEKRRQYLKAYKEKHKDKIRKQAIEYYYAHKEERRQYKKDYNKKHREEIRKYDRDYYYAHIEEKRQYKKAYNEKHKEELRKKALEHYYRTRNKEGKKEKRREYEKKRYERIKGTRHYYELERVHQWHHRGIKITFPEFIEMYNKANGKCEICAKPLSLYPYSGMETAALASIRGKLPGILCGVCCRQLGRYIKKDKRFKKSHKDKIFEKYLENKGVELNEYI